jgi:hypothetical protein
MPIFAYSPIFCMLFLDAAVLGTTLTSDLGGTANGRKKF